MGSSQGGLAIIPSTNYPANPQLGPKPEDGEIGVFGAEKYFKMKLDHYDEANNDRGTRLPPDQMAAKSRRGPSSVSSESSWNSQTALITRNRPHSGKGFLSVLSCVGSCKKGNSVRVNNDEERPAAAHGNHKPVGFQAATVRLSSSTEGYLSPKLRIQSARAKNMQLLMRDHRLSEVQVTSQKDIAVKLEKRLSMLTWDAIPNAPMVPAITRGSCQMIIEDIESDGSSDLFEIENLAVGITDHHQGLFAAQESDEMYEPSESSIEWSVVTASVADHASVVTDYDHEVRFAGISSGLARKAGGSKNKAGGGILGCKSLKSVEVAEPAAYTTNGRPRS